LSGSARGLLTRESSPSDDREPGSGIGASSVAARSTPIGPPGRPASRLRRWLTGKGTRRLISPIVVLLLWQLAASSGAISAQKLPPPTEVWSTAMSLITASSPAYGTLQDNMLVSLERVAAGFACGATVALVLAILAGRTSGRILIRRRGLPPGLRPRGCRPAS
jgi:hypothetical protein